MNRYPKDEPTAENLVCIKALPIPEKNWKNLLGGGVSIHLPLAIGGLTGFGKISDILESSKLT